MTSEAPRLSARWSPLLAGLGPWLGVAGVWWWAGTASPWALFAAAVTISVAVVSGGGVRSSYRGLGVALVLAAILVGFAGERQVSAILDDWDGYWSRRVDEIGDLLSAELDRRQLSGEAASDALIERQAVSSDPVDPSVVRELRERHRSSALALYGPGGELIAWDGTHRGKVPESVQRGERRQSYRDLPLFGYLYLTSKGADGSVAVAAYLLRASLPEGLGADVGDLATRFLAETGELIRITEEDPGIAEAVWDLALDDDRLLSVVLERPDPQERASVVRRRWAVAVTLIGALAWVLLALSGPVPRVEATGAVATLVVGALSVPFAPGGLQPTAFDPSTFVLLGPVGLSLGHFALACVAAFAVMATVPRSRLRLPWWLVAGTVAAVFPALLAWIESVLAPAVLVASRGPWITYEVACAALLALAAGAVLAHARPEHGGKGATVVAVLTAVVLGAVASLEVRRTGSSSILWAVAWAVPAAIAARGAAAWGGWQRGLAGWSVAVVLASTAAIPIAWGQRVAARLDAGAERLEGLAAVEDVAVEDGLVAFARVADSLDTAGAEDVSILYDGWRLSGLADLGYPVWLQIELRDGSPGEGLRVGVAKGEPQPYQDIVAQGRRAGGVRLVQLNEDDARYILTASLGRERMLVAVAPPFPETTGRSALGPLLRGSRDADLEALTVLALPEEEDAPAGPVQRERTREGWRADLGLSFSNGTAYHAHYRVALPGLPLAVARGTLLTVLNLVLFMSLWVTGRVLLGDTGAERPRLASFVISFRARVTLALFGFFALANALFGTVAYRALDQASHRSAQVIAERVVEDAAEWYRALGGQMERLASQVGAELLEYRNGELVEGSLEELLELGLYEGWMPYDAYRILVEREVVQEFTDTSVGRWEYVTAYRRLPDGDVLAAQVPLQEGTSALQTTDLIELLAFVVLLGGALSFALAMVAGRALTRPIRALQVASESVGAGDLGLRLPAHRTDEFGAVFRAFNRMVGRLRRARRQLVRTSRRTQLIMDEAAVGMVALDASGRVTLVNPRAEELLGAEVFVGRTLPSEGELGETLVAWIDDYITGSADEANSDFQVGERRVRVRARRLGSYGTRRGVVVALDDVTDELRAERVLAWGEMARQVAHEVKNPLTPIKLSVQHVRRAWDDRHPDFERILVRNADAMLSEIDRLAEIAQSFSRFGAPGDQVAPLASVSIDEVVREVMALYGSSAADVRFESDLEDGLPSVVARTTELKEVLLNLLENARLAGSEGTRVTIGAQRAESHGHVVLTVTDDGSGIPEEVLPRIFEPQFSTRSKGTGLGLAIVQRVVRSWGGTVAVASGVGRGTEVTVVLREWPDAGDEPPGVEVGPDAALGALGRPSS